MSEIPFNLTEDDIDDKRQLIVVLEGAQLKTAKLRKQVVLLNSDDHRNYIQNKLNLDYSDFRPDVLHHCLLTLQDSPLNKRGLLKIYIHSSDNVIIDVNPRLKVPRTYRRFAAMIAQVLTKLRLRAVEKSETLLKVIKNPITDHLPLEALKIGTSTKAPLTNTTRYFENKIKGNGPIVVVVGAVARGNPGMEAQYVDECICISKYSLSAGYCLNKITNAFEDIWNVK